MLIPYFFSKAVVFQHGFINNLIHTTDIKSPNCIFTTCFSHFFKLIGVVYQPQHSRCDRRRVPRRHKKAVNAIFNHFPASDCICNNKWPASSKRLKCALRCAFPVIARQNKAGGVLQIRTHVLLLAMVNNRSVLDIWLDILRFETRWIRVIGANEVESNIQVITLHDSGSIQIIEDALAANKTTNKDERDLLRQRLLFEMFRVNA